MHYHCQGVYCVPHLLWLRALPITLLFARAAVYEGQSRQTQEMRSVIDTLAMVAHLAPDREVACSIHLRVHLGHIHATLLVPTSRICVWGCLHGNVAGEVYTSQDRVDVEACKYETKHCIH